MISIKICIDQYLAEYCIGKYNFGDKSTPVKFPTSDDLYHLLWQLMRKRPQCHSPIDEGNLEISLGSDNHRGKNPEVYNYLDEKSIRIIECKIKALFYMELHERIIDNIMKGKPKTTTEIVHFFMCDYEIDSISEDALIKNNYRLRQATNKRKKRTYRKLVK